MSAAEHDDVATAGGSSLGRYAPDPAGAALVEVRLLRLPIPLMLASREHHDGLVREFRLLALAGRVQESDAPARFVELVEILGQQYGASRTRRDEELDAAMAAGRETVDLVDRVPATAATAVHGLRALMAEADAYCEQAMLMTLPRPPLLLEFGDWYLDQYVTQIDGGPATPWDGPLRLEGYEPGTRPT